MNEEISAQNITQNLNTSIIGNKVIYYPSITSTNEVARTEAQQKATEGTVIIAGKQTAGRGRLARTWTSPEGVLAMSVILRPELERLNSLIMVASVAVMNTIKETTELKAQIKWPNDVLINGKKVCGILIENGWQGSKLDFSVVGIGVNVNYNTTVNPEIAATATSLSVELERKVSIVTVARQLLLEMDRLYQSESVFEEWKDNLITLGKQVKATTGETIYDGIAESVAADGSLMVRLVDHTLQKIEVGDVTLRT